MYLNALKRCACEMFQHILSLACAYLQSTQVTTTFNLKLTVSNIPFDLDLKLAGTHLMKHQQIMNSFI